MKINSLRYSFKILFLILFFNILISFSSSSFNLFKKREFLTYSFNLNNKTINLNNLNYNLAEGSLNWLNYNLKNSSFYVLNSLISQNEINQMIELLENSSLIFDEDSDSVDNLATHEIYIQRNGNIEGVKDIEGKLDQ